MAKSSLVAKKISAQAEKVRVLKCDPQANKQEIVSEVVKLEDMKSDLHTQEQVHHEKGAINAPANTVVNEEEEKINKKKVIAKRMVIDDDDDDADEFKGEKIERDNHGCEIRSDDEDDEEDEDSFIASDDEEAITIGDESGNDEATTYTNDDDDDESVSTDEEVLPPQVVEKRKRAREQELQELDLNNIIEGKRTRRTTQHFVHPDIKKVLLSDLKDPKTKQVPDEVLEEIEEIFESDTGSEDEEDDDDESVEWTEDDEEYETE